MHHATYQALGHSVGYTAVDEGHLQTSYRVSDDVHHKCNVVYLEQALLHALGKDVGKQHLLVAVKPLAYEAQET